jgi:glycosyltransferase involved in cell wall biosynthesis
VKLAFVNDVVFKYASGDPSAIGGAERYQWLLARALAATGCSVVLGVREGLIPGDRRLIDGVQCVGLRRGHIFTAWHRFLATERPDWWYWQGADHLWGPAVEIARVAGVRTIFSVAVDLDVIPRQALFRRPRWWPMYAWGLSRTDKIFVQHAGQLAALPLRWRSKASILPGIVDMTASLSVKPHSQRDPYVAWVAVLRKVKRPDLLIDIARRLPNVRFVVCGEPSTHRTPPGYTEPVLAALRGQSNIEFLGKVPPDRALRVISDAALLLSTSDEEGFPSTFLEAWAGGTPVVSLRIDLDGLVEREGLGIVAGSIDRAATVVRDLLDSPWQRDAIADRAMRYVTHTHTASAVAAVFWNAITSLLR